MLGIINISLEAFVVETYGEEAWQRVRDGAGLSEEIFVTGCPYADEMTYRLVDVAATQLQLETTEVLESLGTFFITTLNQLGYGGLVRCLGSNIVEMLQRMGELHLHLVVLFPNIVAPVLWVEEVTPESLVLHYSSRRQGLWPIIIGKIKALALAYFGIHVEVQLIKSIQQGHDHEVFKLKYPFMEDLKNWKPCTSHEGNEEDSNFTLPSDIFHETFPYHFAINNKLELTQVGTGLRKLLPGLQTGVSKLPEIFKVLCPSSSSKGNVTFEAIRQDIHSGFTLQILEQPEGAKGAGLRLKGRMVIMHQKKKHPDDLSTTTSCSVKGVMRPSDKQCPFIDPSCTSVSDKQCPSRDPVGTSVSGSSEAHPSSIPPNIFDRSSAFWLGLSQSRSFTGNHSRNGEIEKKGSRIIRRRSLFCSKLSGDLVNNNPDEDEEEVVLFLGAPVVNYVSELEQYGLTLSDLPSIDLVLMTEHSAVEKSMREGYENLALQYQELAQQLDREKVHLAQEKARSESLLYRCMPRDIAERLQAGQQVEATQHSELTVMFTDIVGFTTLSSIMQPMEVCQLLNRLYQHFDDIINTFPDIWKADVIGDAYMLVCNLSGKVIDHVDQMIDLGFQMQQAATKVLNGQEPITIRVGIHTGPAVAGVVGSREGTGMMRYSVFGDTVNTASRMESHGMPDRVHISKAAFDHLYERDKYDIYPRGLIEVKGKGKMQTFIVKQHKMEWLSGHSQGSRHSDSLRLCQRGIPRDSHMGALPDIVHSSSDAILNETPSGARSERRSSCASRDLSNGPLLSLATQGISDPMLPTLQANHVRPDIQSVSKLSFMQTHSNPVNQFSKLSFEVTSGPCIVQQMEQSSFQLLRKLQSTRTGLPESCPMSRGHGDEVYHGPLGLSPSTTLAFHCKNNPLSKTLDYVKKRSRSLEFSKSGLSKILINARQPSQSMEISRSDKPVTALDPSAPISVVPASSISLYQSAHVQETSPMPGQVMSSRNCGCIIS